MPVLLAVNALLNEGGGGEEDYDYEVEIDTTILVFVTILLAITIVFEFIKEKLEEYASNNLRPILHSLWQELTILGFISFLTFFLAKSKQLQKLSEHIFENEEEITEILEKTHIFLFFAMLFFIGQVILLLLLAKRRKAMWKKWEKQIIENKPLVIANYRAALSDISKRSVPVKMFRRIFRAFDKKYQAIQQMEFSMLREEFIHPYNNIRPSLPDDFEFSSYLALQLGETLSELVEIPIPTWGAIWLVILISYGVSFATLDVLQLVISLSSVLLLVTSVKISRKVLSIYMALIGHKQDGGIEDIEGLVGGTNVWYHAGEPLYRNPRYRPTQLKSRSKLGRFLFGDPPNKHELLFWFDRKGPTFLLGFFRLVIILVAFFLALILFFVIPDLESEYLFWAIVNFLFGVFVPIFVTVFGVFPNVLTNFVIVTSIEMMTNQKTILIVQRKQQAHYLLQASKMVRAFFLKMAIRDATRVSQNAEDMQRLIAEVSEERMEEIKDLFRMFDVDGDGSITAEELVKAMCTLGDPITFDEASQVINSLDRDGNDCLEFEEFAVWCAHHLQKMEEVQHAHDEVFYSLFDSERTGHVSFEKFRSTIQFLGVDLDHEAINWLISELDHAGEGTIDMKYLCKYTREISRLRFEHHHKKGLRGFFQCCSKSHH